MQGQHYQMAFRTQLVHDIQVQVGIDATPIGDEQPQYHQRKGEA